MTYCDVCHSRIYTYSKFKIESRTERGVSYKTVCYHCKIKDLEEKIGIPTKGEMKNEP